ncbi:MAG: RHS repeat domain-containing protein [Planctomycetota bacterium]|jgi:hypothetical protein
MLERETCAAPRDGVRLLETRSADGSLKARFTHGLARIEGIGSCVEVYRASDAKRFYMLYDHRGSAHVLLDESKAVVATRLYNAFGETVSETGTWPDEVPFGYQSNWLTLPGTSYGLSPTRIYDAETGRFLQRDPILDLGEFRGTLSYDQEALLAAYEVLSEMIDSAYGHWHGNHSRGEAQQAGVWSTQGFYWEAGAGAYGFAEQSPSDMLDPWGLYTIDLDTCAAIEDAIRDNNRVIQKIAKAWLKWKPGEKLSDYGLKTKSSLKKGGKAWAKSPKGIREAAAEMYSPGKLTASATILASKAIGEFIKDFFGALGGRKCRSMPRLMKRALLVEFARQSSLANKFAQIKKACEKKYPGCRPLKMLSVPGMDVPDNAQK